MSFHKMTNQPNTEATKREQKSLKAGIRVQLSLHAINFFGRHTINAHFKKTPIGQLPIGEVTKLWLKI